MHVRRPTAICGGDEYGKNSSIPFGSTLQFVSNIVFSERHSLTMP